MVRRVSLLGLLVIAAAPLAGCGGMGMTVDRDKLVKTASFDNDCPAEKVKIVSEQDQGMSGTGQYALDVCGKPKKYKRAGTMYYDADKGSPF